MLGAADIIESEARKLSGEHEGLIYVREKALKDGLAKLHQDGVNGAVYLSEGWTAAPALRYVNGNERGRHFIKFDGIEKAADGNGLVLIDAKTKLAAWTPRQQKYLNLTFKRIQSALAQNPGFRVVYEFPDEKTTEEARAFIKSSGYKDVRSAYEEKAMKGQIELRAYSMPDHRVSIEQRHDELEENMREIGAPLGWKKIDVPPAPDCGSELAAFNHFRYPDTRLLCEEQYSYRGNGKHFLNHTTWDDQLAFTFKQSNNFIDYRDLLLNQYPLVIEAFRAYRARTLYSDYMHQYTGGAHDTNLSYNKLLADKSINVDGRNNIFTLGPAMYWGAMLCQRALGYDRDEVIRRLQGKVPLIMPLMDGVYTVFNDDPNLSYEDFAAYNDRYKPILGLA